MTILMYCFVTRAEYLEEILTGKIIPHQIKNGGLLLLRQGKQKGLKAGK